jgi:hypothetical protein
MKIVPPLASFADAGAIEEPSIGAERPKIVNYLNDRDFESMQGMIERWRYQRINIMGEGHIRAKFGNYVHDLRTGGARTYRCERSLCLLYGTQLQ